MKHILESAETCSAYAIIDYCYIMIEELQKETSKQNAPIVEAIDEASGYNKYKNKERINTAISLLKEVIKQKKIIEADYANDEKALQEIQKLK